MLTGEGSTGIDATPSLFNTKMGVVLNQAVLSKCSVVCRGFKDPVVKIYGWIASYACLLCMYACESCFAAVPKLKSNIYFYM